MSDQSIPASLRRRGLRRVTDNLAPLQSVRVPAGAFFTWFGDPLLDYICAQALRGNNQPTTQGSKHGD